MSDAAKQVVRSYVEAAAARQWEAVAARHGEGWHQHNPDGSSLDRRSFRAQLEEIFEAFPDLVPTIHDQIAEGTRVATHLTWTETGPAGEPVRIEVVRLDRVADGKLAHTRVVFDPATASAGP